MNDLKAVYSSKDIIINLDIQYIGPLNQLFGLSLSNNN